MTGSLARGTALAVFGLGLAGFGNVAVAGTPVNFVLNWIAGGDHAPYYYAQQEGWYADAGIDLEIEQGQGSTMAAQRVGLGRSPIGLADLGTVFVVRGQGADMVAVMNVYANSPYGMYWLKSSGIEDAHDLAGRSIGNPPADAARQMWPALAKSLDMEPDAVRWVNVQAAAKLAALKSGSIDATTSFYNIHHIFERELGDDMGYFAWQDYGINPYGNSIVVNADWLAENEDAVAAFVEVTQRAFHHCVHDPEPCVQALVDANTGLQFDNELENWGLVVELMTDETSQTMGLGFFEPSRLHDDYELVETYFEIDTPFDVETAFTNRFLNPDLKMP